MGVRGYGAGLGAGLGLGHRGKGWALGGRVGVVLGGRVKG